MKFFKSICLVFLTLFMYSCTNDSPKMPHKFIEAEKCTEYVTMHIVEPQVSRYTSLTGEENFTASRCQELSGNYVSVAYQGRNGVQKGMVQIINWRTGAVLSELDMLDARINYTHWHKEGSNEYLYIGVDKQGKNGVMCGIVTVQIKNGKFTAGSDTIVAYPYKLEGWSVNCIKTVNNETNALNKSIMYVATGGNDVLGDSERAGFTKLVINPENPMELNTLAWQTSTNYRGYWISYDSSNKTPLGYAFRTVQGNKLVYHIGVIPNAVCADLFNGNPTTFADVEHTELEVFASDTLVDKGRFCITPFVIKNGKFVAVCNGTKEFGIRIYRYDQLENQLVLVDTWNKAANCLTRICGDSGKYYMFAACGNGVYKLELMYMVNSDKKEYIRINPVSKRISTVSTESGTIASTNYVQLSTSKIIHVAGGYEGYYKLDFNDAQFVDADKRK